MHPEPARNESLRNIAIIAHVDHGKTTLVDSLFRQSGVFRSGQQGGERLMDRLDLEREKGITIAAKNCSVRWRGVKINIIDTPGHADFGGEVERGLSMVDGALLLVDAAEGPLPQTRFVLSKALEARLALIVVINKIDRQDARPKAVLDEIHDLLIELDAPEEYLDFSLLYADGRQGIAQASLTEKRNDLHLLLDTILARIPAPRYQQEQPFQMLVSDLSYSDYLGRLAIGKVVNGTARANDALVCLGEDQAAAPLRVTRLEVYEGPYLKEADSADPGDIVVLAGIENVQIGDTICTRQAPAALKRICVDGPTVAMKFMANTSPFSGREGRIVQASRIYDRLLKETLLNVSIRVEPCADGFIVQGRGEFQLAILIETMRREGFELCVGRPQVIFRYENGGRQEPCERLFIDCRRSHTGVVTEKLSGRKGRMLSLSNQGHDRTRLEFSVPSRALIGYRDEFLTDTRGTGVMSSYFTGYEAYRGDLPGRSCGSLVSDRQGAAVPYALFNLEPRGELFVRPGDPVYEGMIVGRHNRENDLDVNPCRTKKLTNMRAAGKDEAVTLTPVAALSLERAIQLIAADEAVEITPKSIRLRKMTLAAQRRKVLERQESAELRRAG